MSGKPVLGLITTGHGPRPEYFAFHGGLLSDLGIDADIVARYALEDLSEEKLDELAPAETEPAIHGYIRVPGSFNKKFGAGWGESWVERSRTIPLVQKCIDELEQEGADVIIYCCAEAYPEGSFQSNKPLILPYRVVVDYIATLTCLSKDNPTVAILTGGSRQRPQQLEMWERYVWSDAINLQYVELGQSPLTVVEKLAESKPDLAVYWGYGVGLAPGDDPGFLGKIESILGQPLILHHVVSTLFARNYFYPSLDGVQYVRQNGG